MYSTRPGLVLGFHGCDNEIINRILTGQESLRKSENEYDWLGHGVYFWENSNSRAEEYASHIKDNPRDSRSSIIYPSVIGTVLNLGYCLDLMDYSNLLLFVGYSSKKMNYILAPDFMKRTTYRSVSEIQIALKDIFYLEN